MGEHLPRISLSARDRGSLHQLQKDLTGTILAALPKDDSL